MKYLDWLAEHNGEDAIRKMVNDRWDLQCKLSIAEKKLELAIVGLGMIRELDRIGEGVAPEEVSDYEQGMGSGFEIAAEVAATTVNNIEETEAKYKRERMLEERYDGA